MTNRQAISKLRKLIQEKDIDSTFTNKFLYSILQQNLKWLIRREVSGGRILRSSSLFQTVPCIEIVKVPKMDNCCPIATNCTMYRTRKKLDDLWEDERGPIILNVTSIDGSTSFTIVSVNDYRRKKDNPYKTKSENYGFFDQGHPWFEEKAPKKINIQGFFTEDLDGKYGCDPTCCDGDCISFLDKKFISPSWIDAELFMKSLEQLINTKKASEDTQIDKNINRKA